MSFKLRRKRNAFLENPRKRRANDTIVGAVTMNYLTSLLSFVKLVKLDDWFDLSLFF